MIDVPSTVLGEQNRQILYSDRTYILVERKMQKNRCIYMTRTTRQQVKIIRSIPALWEAEAGGSRGQEIQTILVNMKKPRLY